MELAYGARTERGSCIHKPWVLRFLTAGYSDLDALAPVWVVLQKLGEVISLEARAPI